MEPGERQKVVGAGVVLVAVDASKEITSYALEWAIQNAVRPDNTLILLALYKPFIPTPSSSTLKQKFLFTEGQRRSRRSLRRSLKSLLKKCSLWDGTRQEVWSQGIKINGKEFGERLMRIKEDCVGMINEVCWEQNAKLLDAKVELFPTTCIGSIANKAEEYHAKWVILDWHLKKESVSCLSSLNCNIVMVDHAIPETLKFINPLSSSILAEEANNVDELEKNEEPYFMNQHHSCSFTTCKINISSSSACTCTPDQEVYSPLNSYPIIQQKEFKVVQKMSPTGIASMKTISSLAQTRQRRSLDSLSRQSKERPVACTTAIKTSSLRKAMLFSVKQLPPPPPLCSVCKHSVPDLSKPPKKFSFEELEQATNGYSEANLLGEGGFGPVYRGELEDGQVVAVKKHRAAGVQGATEFCSEVEVLSCVQQRNLVKLLGYCYDGEWLLVYEYACNGSLDKHLHGVLGQNVMAWKHRQKVAIGSARALRYLHEDCRMGCIIHRDFRPKNILLTHDFEPMVGDFGLAKWQTNGQTTEESCVIGALGYLAPEYLHTGKITEKTDVYAFGVMLMELIIGVKALELNKRNLHHSLLKMINSSAGGTVMMHELIDRRLNGNYDTREVECMMRIAAACISPDPDMRPRMSKVLGMLEEDIPSSSPTVMAG